MKSLLINRGIAQISQVRARFYEICSRGDHVIHVSNYISDFDKSIGF